MNLHWPRSARNKYIFDKCLVAAGLLDDSRTMLIRLNDLLLSLVLNAEKNVDSGDDDKKA